jgi:plasmid stabilization system protein ParE
MPKSQAVSIVWTENSLQHAIEMKRYLMTRFSRKEVQKFYILLESFEVAVCAFPELYPRSTYKRSVRRAVLSKELSAFYRINRGRIEVLALLDNRCDTSSRLKTGR